MLCSPFSLVPCLSSRGLSWRDSWQTYTVNLGHTDLHTHRQQPWHRYHHTVQCKCKQSHYTLPHTWIWVHWIVWSHLLVHKSGPSRPALALTNQNLHRGETPMLCNGCVTTLHPCFILCDWQHVFAYLRSERRAVCRNWSDFSAAISVCPVWRQWGSTAVKTGIDTEGERQYDMLTCNIFFFQFIHVTNWRLTSELPWLPGSAWWLGEDESLENKDKTIRSGETDTHTVQSKLKKQTHWYLSSTEEVV